MGVVVAELSGREGGDDASEGCATGASFPLAFSGDIESAKT